MYVFGNFHAILCLFLGVVVNFATLIYVYLELTPRNYPQKHT